MIMTLSRHASQGRVLGEITSSDMHVILLLYYYVETDESSHPVGGAL